MREKARTGSMTLSHAIRFKTKGKRDENLRALTDQGKEKTS